MDFNNTNLHNFNGSTNISFENGSSGDSGDVNIQVLAMTYLSFKIGDAINKYYFLVLVPVGVVGNTLSFLVMMQKHNRHMSISIYLSALAVTDTISLMISLLTNLVDNGSIKFNSNYSLYCKINFVAYMASPMCSTLFILSMTFDRFYSIIRPHKAASFNTVKRAKITIVCVIILSMLISFPNWYTTKIIGNRCYALADSSIPGQVYTWLVGNTFGFIFPFTSLLVMNSVIVYSLRQRSKLNLTHKQGQGQIQGHAQKVKRSEKNIFVTLLLVTCSYLMLTLPSTVVLVFLAAVDYQKSPKMFADFFLFLSIGHRMYVTNFAINFFLYVISGTKFRTDLVHLFKRRGRQTDRVSDKVSEVAPGTSWSNLTMQNVEGGN